MSRTNELLIGLLLLITSFWLFWLLVCLPSMYWTGGFDLTIHITNPTSSVQSIHGATVDRVDEAKIVMQPANRRKVDLNLKQLVADPYRGGPLKIRCWQGGSESYLGFETSHSQEKALILIAQMADGSEVWKLVEIPDNQVSREVTVTLP